MYNFSISDLTDEELEIAEKNGIGRNVLNSRLNLDWDVDRAITESVKQYESFKEIWDRWKGKAVVSRDLMYQRWRKGIGEEEAAMSDIGSFRNRSKRWTSEELETMKKNGISINAANGRIRLKWSKEDAIKTPIMTEQERIERVREGVKKRRVHREFNKTV